MTHLKINSIPSLHHRAPSPSCSGSCAAVLSALVLAAGGSSDSQLPEAHRGSENIAARVQARVLRAVVVRQATGLESAGPNTPEHQVTRRDDEVMIEFK